jgi:hypothetical protein
MPFSEDWTAFWFLGLLWRCTGINRSGKWSTVFDLALPDIPAPFVSKSAVAQARQR